jgi:hypothetical protein
MHRDALNVFGQTDFSEIRIVNDYAARNFDSR